ncbi:MAG: hypothetical protein LBS11_05145 [Oscillospiraceae bacterium]|nr:hypothetical protein [Oscillospiraceae bacterium]
MAELMSDWDGSLCLFTDPNRFIDGLFRALRKRERVINILFRDRMEALISKFEDALLALYLRESDSARDAIRLSFVVGGASRVFLNGKYDYNTDSKVLADILTRISARTTA